MSKPDGTACDHPCLFGVRPGETTWEQAGLLLHSHPLTRAAKWLDDHTLQLTGTAAYVAFSHTSDGLIDSIILSDKLDDSGISESGSLVDSMALGEVILAFGIPNVGLPGYNYYEVGLPGSSYFVVGFPDVGIIAVLAQPYNLKTSLKANSLISTIMISIVGPCSSPIYFQLHPWMGFTTFERYLNDRRGYKVSHRVSGVPIPPYAQCQQ